MFPFNSPSDALALLIPAILLLYVIILLKLKPSEDNSSQPNSMPTETQRRPLGSEILRNPTTVANVRRTNKQPPPNSEIEASKQITKHNAQNQQVKVEQTIKLDEQTRDKKKKKSFFLFGEQDFGGCRHKPGHLSTVPKNTPIPEECFGCPEILECMKYKTK